jgi:hypothetical protein
MSRRKKVAESHSHAAKISGKNLQATEATYFALADTPPLVEQLTGTRPGIRTPYRWRSDGIRGVRLRTAYIHGAHRTTREWLREFFEAVATADKSKKQKAAS